MDYLIKKGLRQLFRRIPVITNGLNGFPDQERIKTRPCRYPLRCSLNGFPDQEGIKTSAGAGCAASAGLNGFPDQEGNKTRPYPGTGRDGFSTRRPTPTSRHDGFIWVPIGRKPADRTAAYVELDGCEPRCLRTQGQPPSGCGSGR